MIIRRNVGRLILLLGIGIFALPALAQSGHDDSLLLNELRFARHLMRQQQLDEAVFVLHKMRAHSVFENHTDTIDFLLGTSYLSLHKLDSSKKYYSRVSQGLSFSTESSFFSALSAMYLGQHVFADSVLSGISIDNDEEIFQLLLTERAGLSLLRRDSDGYLQHSAGFGYDHFAVQLQQRELNSIYTEIAAFRKKSPFVAGMLSTAVPGLGKVYAKRYGDGISTFLINLSLGVMAWENYRKDGITDPKTIVFGSIFSIFYIGNIWGSVFSIKMYRDEFNDVIDEQIMYNMHTSLRNYYQ